MIGTLILAQATMLASFASVTLAAVARGEVASTLRRGLESNREIGVAMGIIMARHQVTQDQAFALLRLVSQESNRKVVDIAAQIATTGELPQLQGRRPPA